ncbi:MAG: type II secretion system protein [Deltaproteobacteria bacterium]|nr:type II secretion system protein [Deltaproteobacteria bacterium]
MALKERKRRCAKGFTLIETVMSIVILGIVAVTAGLLIYQGTRSYGEMDRMRGLTAQATLASERMARELMTMRCSNSNATRCLPTASDITVMTGQEVRFVNSNNEGRGLRLDGAANAVKLRQGINNGDPEDALAGKVSGLTFTYLDRSNASAASAVDVWTVLMDITLTDGNQSVSIRGRAHPKAFER